MDNLTHSSVFGFTRRRAIGSLAFRLLCLIFCLRAHAAFAAEIKYVRSEATIAARDGVKLYTVIFRPEDQKAPLPFILHRTPYGVRSAEPFRMHPELAKEGYIFVFQDIRGRFDSEGAFRMMRPPRDRRDPKSTDEASDTYDSIEWLLKNVPANNGRAGMLGISYDGTLTVNAAADPHPALRAVSPQSPAMDMFLGDDFHHNGAFRLAYGFEYGTMMETDKQITPFRFDLPDAFDWYLRAGALSSINTKYLHDKIPTWNNFVAHPNYDAFWKVQAYARHFEAPRIPTLNVTGWWDQEDFYGPQAAYATWEKRDLRHLNYLVIGPWNHGGWAEGYGDSLGAIKFGGPTARTFREQIEAPWFAYWLKDKGRGQFPEVRTFRTGANIWKEYRQWPPRDHTARKSLYLEPDGSLGFDPPNRATPYHEYISDPADPVPYRKRPIQATYSRGSLWQTWLVQDQQFLEGRRDVVSWQTPPLTEDLTVAGEVIARLFASTTGSDSDWIVKLIDVYPADEPDPAMANFRLMICSEVMRGRFRKSFSVPEPVKPNDVNAYTWSLHATDHTFKKGHRIMVQVQSTWFPIIDRNPQKYVPNIFEATDADFIKATQRVYHTPDHPSRLDVTVVQPNAQ